MSDIYIAEMPALVSGDEDTCEKGSVVRMSELKQNIFMHTVLWMFLWDKLHCPHFDL